MKLRIFSLLLLLTMGALAQTKPAPSLPDKLTTAEFAHLMTEANVKKLPINEPGLFIRSVLDRYDHPTHTPGHLFTMLLQRIGVFVKDYDDGKYKDYYQLVITNYIGVGR